MSSSYDRDRITYLAERAALKKSWFARDQMQVFLREHPVSGAEAVLDAALEFDPGRHTFDFAAEYLGSCKGLSPEGSIGPVEYAGTLLRNLVLRSPPQAEIFFCTTSNPVPIDSRPVEDLYRRLQDAVAYRKGCVGVAMTSEGLMVSLTLGKCEGFGWRIDENDGMWWSYTP